MDGPSVAELRKRLDGLTIRDAARLGRRLKNLRGAPPEKLGRIAEQIAAAEELIATRLAALPAISYPDLPVSERRDEIANHVIREFAEFAPNIPDRTVGMQVLAPPDLEARFGLTGGHIFHGELVPEQAFDMRPVPGSSSYEGPVHGLFLCGSGAWPGGCVMGAPGHNAAQEIIGRFRDVR